MKRILLLLLVPAFAFTLVAQDEPVQEPMECTHTGAHGSHKCECSGMNGQDGHPEDPACFTKCRMGACCCPRKKQSSNTKPGFKDFLAAILKRPLVTF
jgi:hypothetical protein